MKNSIVWALCLALTLSLCLNFFQSKKLDRLEAMSNKYRARIVEEEHKRREAIRYLNRTSKALGESVR